MTEKSSGDSPKVGEAWAEGSSGILVVSAEFEQDVRERVEALAQLLDVRVMTGDEWWGNSGNRGAGGRRLPGAPRLPHTGRAPRRSFPLHPHMRGEGEASGTDAVLLALCASSEECAQWECAGVAARRIGYDGDLHLPGDENTLGTLLGERIHEHAQRRRSLGEYPYLRVFVAAWDRISDSEHLAWELSRDRGGCLIEVCGAEPGRVHAFNGISWADISADEQVIIPRILDDMPVVDHVRLLSGDHRSGASPGDPRIPRVINACASRTHVIVHAGMWNPQMNELSRHVDAVILTGRTDERGLASLCALTGAGAVHAPCVLVPTTRAYCGHTHRLASACTPHETISACHTTCGTPTLLYYPRTLFGGRKARIKLWSTLQHAVKHARI